MGDVKQIPRIESGLAGAAPNFMVGFHPMAEPACDRTISGIKFSPGFKPTVNQSEVKKIKSDINNAKMLMTQLTNFHVAVLATDGFEVTELTEPVAALKAAGAQVSILSLNDGKIRGFRHDLDKAVQIEVDRLIRDVSAAEFDAVHLPGGTVNADKLRMVPEVQAFLCAMQDAGKPISAICHAPWELVSAGLVRGRTLTSCQSIQDDIRNAGGHWVDKEVVEDDNWVTSRKPDDLPAFNRAMISLFSKGRSAIALKA